MVPVGQENTACEFYIDEKHPFCSKSGFRIDVGDSEGTGGGAIILKNFPEKIMHIYGHGTGAADHSLSQEIIQKSGEYPEYKVTWSEYAEGEDVT